MQSDSSTKFASRWWRLVAVLGALAMLAGACSGESDDDDTATATTEEPGTTEDPGTTDDPGTSEDPGTTDDPGTTSAPGSGTITDPRGDLFNDFQATFDRSHPFQSMDAFCLPHEAAADRQATDPGITADGIEIHQLRQQLEDLIQFGFGVEVGDVEAMFDAFVAEINDNCGGIRGRMLELERSSYSPITQTVLEDQNANCLEATEDRNAVITMSSSGFVGPAVLCVVEEHDTAFIGTTGLPDDYYERAEGRAVTLDQSQSESMRFMVEKLHADGLLEGKTIAVIGQDSPGQPETVDGALVATLEELGYTVTVRETLGCGGGTTCGEGVSEAASNMFDEGVDAVFGALNVLSLPGLVSEMAVQGFEPGDAMFFNSNFNSQATDLVASKVSANGGPDAAALYNGAWLTHGQATGNFRLPGYEVPAFNQLCLDTYAGQGGPQYDVLNEEENSPSGMVASVCAQFRIIARAIYDAGDNPTRQDIYDAMANLGPVDVNNGLVASLEPGKGSTPNTFQTMTFTWPCELGEEFAYDEASGSCVVPNADWYLARE
ncbi:MAG: ABC transporter substrate-binding protein [Acidimicrobiales bacterium]|nr:ABC transporter substrate-binding protein [Acidimicrobiales bacterium]